MIFPLVVLLFAWSSPFSYDHFLPPPGWLESPDPSLRILASLASIISESLLDVVIPDTLRLQTDQVFSEIAT